MDDDEIDQIKDYDLREAFRWKYKPTRRRAWIDRQCLGPNCKKKFRTKFKTERLCEYCQKKVGETNDQFSGRINLP